MRWLLILLLAGCQTVPVPDKVLVPVAVSCLPANPPVRPETFTDKQLSAMTDFHLVLGLRQNATRLDLYALELEAVLTACK